MHDRTPPSPPPGFERSFHPEQLDLDQFAAAIRLLLAPEKHRQPDLLSTARQAMNVSVEKPN